MNLVQQIRIFSIMLTISSHKCSNVRSVMQLVENPDNTDKHDQSNVFTSTGISLNA
jgi:hypothetical protein